MTIKAHYYHEQLENARCDGNWPAVLELVRKVRKHTPSRACISLSAETECAVSSMTTAGIRPSAAFAARNLDVINTVPQLRAAIDEEHANPEDRFQAQVCVGWLHWVVGSYDLALQRLPKSVEDAGLELDSVSLMGEWTCVCALKSAYLRANCLMRDGKTAEALAALKAAMPVTKRVESGRNVKKQLRHWSELFLTEYCMLSSAAIENGDVSLEDALTLAPFRSWATYWDVMGAPVTGRFGFRGSVPRRQIWCEYYAALSQILQKDLNYEGGHAKGIPAEHPIRSQLRAELKFAESAYRSLLLAETCFPRADEEREEVETFVQRVIKNWSLLCGRGWSEEHLGQGGRVAISRGVLELLYSSATRTYHSTVILRSLFVVHLSLAEFDLAFKAFDSYLEIIKGKARVDKTGEAEPGLDSDEKVLETMAQAIMTLCSYGNRKAGEKALGLGAELEDWLSRLPPVKGRENGTLVIVEDVEGNAAQASIAPHVIASAWQAIGLCHAHWSRLTSEAGSRTEIQAKAIRCFRNSLAADFGRCKDIRSFFSLALLLAERRELTAAIELTRSALLSCKSTEQSHGLQCGPYWQERSLIPLWHLLALLLSARQDYAMAFRACEGALEQFKDSCTLFGRADAPAYRSEHLNGTGTPSACEPRRGLVDDMDDAEKEALLEIKITQLRLIELTEGSNVAVNASYELLALFTRLFGDVGTQEMTTAAKVSQPPRTSGTLRSIRGSIFGTKVDRSSGPPVPTVPAFRQPTASTINEKTFVLTSRSSTANSAATSKPAIQVTSESEGQLEATGRSRRSISSHGPRGESRRRSSLKKCNRSGSRPRPETAGALSQAIVVDGDAFFTPVQEPDQLGAFSFLGKQAQVQARGKASSYLSIAGKKGGDYSELPGETTHAPPHLLPLIQFSKEKARAQRTMILMRIWLTIAGFYRRTRLAEDCKGAIAEAQKLVQALEEAESRREQGGDGGRQYPGSGWAEKRSVDDCWGDVWSELGLLALAQGEPYTGRSDFEQALVYCPDHPEATVNLCSILLDVYCEKLLPNPVVAPLDLSDPLFGEYSQIRAVRAENRAVQGLGRRPLGLGPAVDATASVRRNGLDASRRGDNKDGEGGKAVDKDDDDGGDDVDENKEEAEGEVNDDDELTAAYKAVRLPLVDRLAARDRAHALLTRLTRLGSGWQRADAWFVLARAYEESGQADKAREVLWWCVELEEASGVRDWRCLAGGGYLI